MNVTLVPVQIVVALAAMLTDGVTGAVTVIVMELDVTDDCVTHASEDVMTTVTTSLLASAAFW